MDAERMTVLAFHTLPPWAMALSLAADLVAGAALGILHLRTLWWNARRFAQGRRPMTSAALMVARFAVLGGVLLLVSQEGALPLLASIVSAAVAVSFGAIGPALAEGRAVAAAMDAIARQPESASTISRTLFVGLAMIETMAIYRLVIALLLLFANPLLKQ
jgi:F-type H+-transporting ATPase subunit c